MTENIIENIKTHQSKVGLSKIQKLINPKQTSEKELKIKNKNKNPLKKRIVKEESYKRE